MVYDLFDQEWKKTMHRSSVDDGWMEGKLHRALKNYFRACNVRIWDYQLPLFYREKNLTWFNICNYWYKCVLSEWKKKLCSTGIMKRKNNYTHKLFDLIELMHSQKSPSFLHWTYLLILISWMCVISYAIWFIVCTQRIGSLPLWLPCQLSFSVCLAQILFANCIVGRMPNQANAPYSLAATNAFAP